MPTPTLAALQAEISKMDNRAELRRVKHNARNRLWRLKQHIDMDTMNAERHNAILTETDIIKAVDHRLLQIKLEEDRQVINL